MRQTQHPCLRDRHRLTDERPSNNTLLTRSQRILSLSQLPPLPPVQPCLGLFLVAFEPFVHRSHQVPPSRTPSPASTRLRQQAQWPVPHDARPGRRGGATPMNPIGEKSCRLRKIEGLCGAGAMVARTAERSNCLAETALPRNANHGIPTLAVTQSGGDSGIYEI